MILWPFPASKITVASALQSIADQSNNVRALASRYATTMASTTVSSYELLFLLDAFVTARRC